VSSPRPGSQANCASGFQVAERGQPRSGASGQRHGPDDSTARTLAASTRWSAQRGSTRRPRAGRPSRSGQPPSTIRRCSSGRPDPPIVQEEVFGPVATFEAFESEADAVRLAKLTEYGLAASIWSRDIDGRGGSTAAARRTVWTNTWASSPTSSRRRLRTEWPWPAERLRGLEEFPGVQDLRADRRVIHCVRTDPAFEQRTRMKEPLQLSDRRTVLSSSKSRDRERARRRAFVKIHCGRMCHTDLSVRSQATPFRSRSARARRRRSRDQVGTQVSDFRAGDKVVLSFDFLRSLPTLPSRSGVYCQQWIPSNLLGGPG